MGGCMWNYDFCSSDKLFPDKLVLIFCGFFYGRFFCDNSFGFHPTKNFIKNKNVETGLQKKFYFMCFCQMSLFFSFLKKKQEHVIGWDIEEM